MILISEGPTRLTLSGNEREISAVAQKLRYHPQGYFHSPKFKAYQLTDGREGWDGYLSPIRIKDDGTAFCLRGHKDTIIRLARKMSFNVDTRECLESPFAELTPDDLPDDLIAAEFALDEYQRESVAYWLKNGMGVNKLAVNSGKTACFAAAAEMILRRFSEERCLYITQSERLARQAFRDMSNFLPHRNISQYGGGKRDKTGKEIVVSTVAMLWKNHSTLLKERWFNEFIAILYDECFPAGTLVDGIPIEKIKTGTPVTSYNHIAGRLEKKPVLRLFHRKAQRLIRIETENGTLVCTPNHPIFVNNSYLPAFLVRPGDNMVHCAMRMYNDDKKIQLHSQPHLPGMSKTVEIKNQNSQILFLAVPDCGQAKALTKNPKNMCLVPDQIPVFKKVGPNTGKTRKENLLLTRLFQCLQSNDFFKNNGQNESEICFRTHEKTQSNEAAGCPGKTKNFNEGLETENTWRKWKIHSPTGNTGSSIELGYGSSYSNPPEAWFTWAAQLLQNQHCQSNLENSNRSGRLRTQNPVGQTAGREKNSIFRSERVESVEILERGNNEEFERLCPKGDVYNLEIEGNNNYFANNYLVHNCHHVAAPTSQKLIMLMPAFFRLGASDTKKEKDAGDVAKIRGLLGPIRYTVPVGVYIDMGRSAKPTIYVVENPAWKDRFSELPHIVKPNTPAWALIDDQWRSGTYVGPVFERDEEGKIKTTIKKQLEDEVDEGEVVKEDGTTQAIKMARWKEVKVPITVNGYHALQFPGDKQQYEIESTWCLLERVNDRALIRFKERNQLIVDWTHYYSRVRKFPTLVVCTRTLHIYILESLIKKAVGDDRVQILLGDHTSKERDRVFDWFRHTPGGVLISPLVQEGVSINEIRGGVIADYVGDWERANQIIGRFIRKKQDENEAHITWFFDNQHESLRRGSKRVLNRLFDIRGYTFVHPVLGPETVSKARVYRTLD